LVLRISASAKMNAHRTVRSLLPALLAVGLLLAAIPDAASASAAVPRAEAAVKSAPQSSGCAAVKMSQAEPVPRAQEESREQFKLGRLLEKSLRGGPALWLRVGARHRAEVPGDPSLVALQVRLQL
jgi:hypothetical protein